MILFMDFCETQRGSKNYVFLFLKRIGIFSFGKNLQLIYRACVLFMGLLYYFYSRRFQTREVIIEDCNRESYARLI